MVFTNSGHSYRRQRAGLRRSSFPARGAGLSLNERLRVHLWGAP